MSSAPGRAKQRENNPLSDQQLVRDCLKGKATAWSDLIFRYKNLIFSIPIRYGFSEEDSADIFQAVCMDLLAELPSLREPKALAGCLNQVTRNKCFHRKREAQRHPTQDIGEDEPMGTGESADSLASELQLDRLLREALSELTPRCRRLVQKMRLEYNKQTLGPVTLWRSGVSGARHDFRRIAHSRGSMFLRITVAG
jgi:RNA polymerase sigma factor (sigma-70 family)